MGRLQQSANTRGMGKNTNTELGPASGLRFFFLLTICNAITLYESKLNQFTVDDTITMLHFLERECGAQYVTLTRCKGMRDGEKSGVEKRG